MLYFAYGMNTNNSAMSKTSQRLGPAVLVDYKWEMLQFANVFESRGDTAIGILWEIDETELQDLDCREGYPTFYDRVVATVGGNRIIGSSCKCNGVIDAAGAEVGEGINAV